MRRQARGQVSSLPNTTEPINVKARSQTGSDSEAPAGQDLAVSCCTLASWVITHAPSAAPPPLIRPRKWSSQVRRVATSTRCVCLAERYLPVKDTSSEWGLRDFKHSLLKPSFCDSLSLLLKILLSHFPALGWKHAEESLTNFLGSTSRSHFKKII